MERRLEVCVEAGMESERKKTPWWRRLGARLRVARGVGRDELAAAWLRVVNLELENARLGRELEQLRGIPLDRQLAAGEARRLTDLARDCADLQFCALTVLRDGWCPRPGRPLRNRLEERLGQLRASTDALVAARDVRNREIEEWRQRRLEKRAAAAAEVSEGQ